MVNVVTTGDGAWNSTSPDAPWPGGTKPTDAEDARIAHAVTMGANEDCKSVTILSGGSLDLSGYQITIKGQSGGGGFSSGFTFRNESGAGTFTHSNGTVKIDNSGISLGGVDNTSTHGSFYNLQFNGDGILWSEVHITNDLSQNSAGRTLQISQDALVEGNLNITAGTVTTSYDGSDYALTVEGSVDVASGAIFTMNASTVSIGSFNSVGTTTFSTGTTTITGAV